MKANLNTKSDGYFELRENGELITDVYGKLTRNGEPKKCQCCGRTVTSYFETEYYDEHDNGHFGIYGTECFKKIAVWDDSIIAM